MRDSPELVFLLTFLILITNGRSIVTIRDRPELVFLLAFLICITNGKPIVTGHYERQPGADVLTRFPHTHNQV